MSIREGAKSLLRETANFAQWLRFNLSNSIEIGRNAKVRGAKIAENVRIGAQCNIQGGKVDCYSYMGNYNSCDVGCREPPHELCEHISLHLFDYQKFFYQKTAIYTRVLLYRRNS